MGRSGSYTVTAAAPGVADAGELQPDQHGKPAGECDGDGGDAAKHGDQHGVWDGAAGDGAGCGQQSGVGVTVTFTAPGSGASARFSGSDDGDGGDE